MKSLKYQILVLLEEVSAKKGMTFAIEPMINLGSAKTKVLSDGWTVVTIDGNPSAHFEHTISVGIKAAEILTTPIENV